jgi:hypothetical protein
MKTMTLFSIAITAALMFAVVLSVPASAQPNDSGAFALLPSTSGLPTVVEAKAKIYGGVYGGWHGGGPWFYGGGWGPYWGYGGYGDGYGYYREGTSTCVWNGYNYRCYKTYPDVY